MRSPVFMSNTNQNVFNLKRKKILAHAPSIKDASGHTRWLNLD